MLFIICTVRGKLRNIATHRIKPVIICRQGTWDFSQYTEILPACCKWWINVKEGPGLLKLVDYNLKCRRLGNFDNKLPPYILGKK